MIRQYTYSVSRLLADAFAKGSKTISIPEISSINHRWLSKTPSFHQGVGRLNHIAIAVPDVEKAAERYRSTLGISKVSIPHSLPEHGVRVVFVELENTKLELLQPLGDDSPISNYLKKNKEGGLHHICLEVPDIHAAIETVSRSNEVRLLNDKPKIGAHGTPVVFLHPKDMNGVLTELEQVKNEQIE